MLRSWGSRLVVAAIAGGALVAAVACAQIAGIADLEVGECRGGVCDGGGVVPPMRDAEVRDVAMDTSPTNCEPGCTGTETCCNSRCEDFATSPASCGVCGNACAPTERCAAGACQLLPLGNGADGPLSATAETTINTVASGGLAAASGQRVIAVASTTGFVAGDLVLLHQTRGPGAGTHELATVESIDSAGKTITLVRAVASTYATDGAAARAQIVRVPQHTTLEVAAGSSLVAPAWNGESGGLLVLKATGAVTVTGSIDMSGRGFRGSSHAGGCAGGTRYACTAANTANGFAGESAAGVARGGPAANGGGGGGGEDGQDCAGGGGGGYGAAGTGGANGAGLVCRNGPQLGGAAGEAAGSADLSLLLFGGAGGEGGGDEDGAYPGAGGNGGGVVWIDALAITVAGRVASDGAKGGDGVSVDPACGGAGCGMGPGGGGAGGAIMLRATSATLGDGLVTANGNTGGACTCPGLPPGGSGGVGRIAIAGAATGTTSPAFVVR